MDGYRRIGVGEVIFVFRTPFDHETIERIGEVRAALGGERSVVGPAHQPADPRGRRPEPRGR